MTFSNVCESASRSGKSRDWEATPYPATAATAREVSRHQHHQGQDGARDEPAKNTPMRNTKVNTSRTIFPIIISCKHHAGGKVGCSVGIQRTTIVIVPGLPLGPETRTRRSSAGSAAKGQSPRMQTFPLR